MRRLRGPSRTGHPCSPGRSRRNGTGTGSCRPITRHPAKWRTRQHLPVLPRTQRQESVRCGVIQANGSPALQDAHPFQSAARPHPPWPVPASFAAPKGSVATATRPVIDDSLVARSADPSQYAVMASSLCPVVTLAQPQGHKACIRGRIAGTLSQNRDLPDKTQAGRPASASVIRLSVRGRETSTYLERTGLEFICKGKRRTAL